VASGLVFLFSHLPVVGDLIRFAQAADELIHVPARGPRPALDFFWKREHVDRLRVRPCKWRENVAGKFAQVLQTRSDPDDWLERGKLVIRQLHIVISLYHAASSSSTQIL